MFRDDAQFPLFCPSMDPANSGHGQLTHIEKARGQLTREYLDLQELCDRDCRRKNNGPSTGGIPFRGTPNVYRELTPPSYSTGVRLVSASSAHRGQMVLSNGMIANGHKRGAPTGVELSVHSIDFGIIRRVFPCRRLMPCLPANCHWLGACL